VRSHITEPYAERTYDRCILSTSRAQRCGFVHGKRASHYGKESEETLKHSLRLQPYLGHQ
jgi:hypothetical protein